MLYTINHPNVVSFLGVSFYEGAVMIIQEYCPQNLFQYIEEKGAFYSKNIDEFLDMILIILDTLSFLHENHNVAHRDLKPENILLDHENRPKICDLGMVKFLQRGERTLHRTDGGLMGTPGYMPPEVITLKTGDQYEPKYWDMFSMAMIIYYMWTGMSPLAKEFPHGFVRNEEISKGTRPILPSSMSTELKDIVRTMWEQDYRKRSKIHEISRQLNNLYTIQKNENNHHNKHKTIINDNSLIERNLEMNRLRDDLL